MICVFDAEGFVKVDILLILPSVVSFLSETDLFVGVAELCILPFLILKTFELLLFLVLDLEGNFHAQLLLLLLLLLLLNLLLIEPWFR